MPKLTKEEHRQLREAVLSAYPNPDDLEIFVAEALGQNLATITGRGKYRYVVFELIGEAISQGFIDQLILTLAQDTQNPDIFRFYARVLPPYLDLNDASTTMSPLIKWSLEKLTRRLGIDVFDETLHSFCLNSSAMRLMLVRY